MFYIKSSSQTQGKEIVFHIIYLFKKKKKEKKPICLGEIRTANLSLYGKLSNWLGYDNWCINGDHSPNVFRQTSLLFHKWLADRFNLDDPWIVNVGYKNTSIANALITWIGKFCKFVHKQNCSHDFFLLYRLSQYCTS